VRIPISALACALLLNAGQQPGPSLLDKGTIETLHLTAATSVSVPKQAGASRTLIVDIAPKPKMHLYAPGEKEGMPVSLTIDAQPAFKASPPLFPPPEKYYFEPLKLTQLVFSKTFRITQPIVLSKSSPTGLTIEGSLRYQACDDRVCYLPKTIRLSWKIEPPA